MNFILLTSFHLLFNLKPNYNILLFRKFPKNYHVHILLHYFFFNFRVRFTKEQWQYMLEYFKTNQRPNHEEKLAMSKHLGLSMCTIMIFFCNRRTRLATKGHFWRDFKVLFYLQLSHTGAFRHDLVRWMNKIPVEICDKIIFFWHFICTHLVLSLGISSNIHHTRSYQYAPLFDSLDEI